VYADAQIIRKCPADAVDKLGMYLPFVSWRKKGKEKLQMRSICNKYAGVARLTTTVVMTTAEHTLSIC
jgi:hypothetical protein